MNIFSHYVRADRAIVAGVSIIILVLGGCSQSNPDVSKNVSTLNKVLAQKVLRVGYLHYPPSTFLDSKSGEVRGHFVDTLREIIRRLDPTIKLEFEETTFADFTAALNTGRIDLSIGGTFTTIPRSRAVAFTTPLVYLGRSAIVKKGDNRFDPLKGPEQFDQKNIKIGVVEGEGSHEYVRANFKNIDNVIVFSGSDLSQCLAAVSSGQVDVGMSDALETAKYARSRNDVVDLFGNQPYDLTPIAWAVRQDDTQWLNFLNTSLHLLEVQGTLEKFEKPYNFPWSHLRRKYTPS